MPAMSLDTRSEKRTAIQVFQLRLGSAQGCVMLSKYRAHALHPLFSSLLKAMLFLTLLCSARTYSHCPSSLIFVSINITTIPSIVIVLNMSSVRSHQTLPSANTWLFAFHDPYSIPFTSLPSTLLPLSLAPPTLLTREKNWTCLKGDT